MRAKFVSVCMAAFALSAAAQSVDHASLTGLLAAHVHGGRVDYAALKENRSTLDKYLNDLSLVEQASFDAWPEPERLAFLINVYNAATLQLITNHYPVASIKDITGVFSSPWRIEFISLFGKMYTLDDIEHGMIRKHYAEPRIHFALVCAAKSCPPLRDEAFEGAKLDMQLTSQAEAFLRDPAKNRLDTAASTLHLSSIFKWYQRDFAADEASLIRYVAPFLSGPDRSWLDANAVKLEFLNYDWSLNK